MIVHGLGSASGPMTCLVFKVAGKANADLVTSNGSATGRAAASLRVRHDGTSEGRAAGSTSGHV